MISLFTKDLPEEEEDSLKEDLFSSSNNSIIFVEKTQNEGIMKKDVTKNLQMMTTQIKTKESSSSDVSRYCTASLQCTATSYTEKKEKKSENLFNPKLRYYVKPKFLKVLKTMVKNQETFTYEELAKHLSNYILSKRDQFFDERNIKVCMVKDDILGEAFNVKAFHRSQVTSFLKFQIIYKHD